MSPVGGGPRSGGVSICCTHDEHVPRRPPSRFAPPRDRRPVGVRRRVPRRGGRGTGPPFPRRRRPGSTTRGRRRPTLPRTRCPPPPRCSRRGWPTPAGASTGRSRSSPGVSTAANSRRPPAAGCCPSKPRPAAAGSPKPATGPGRSPSAGTGWSTRWCGSARGATSPPTWRRPCGGTAKPGSGARPRSPICRSAASTSKPTTGSSPPRRGACRSACCCGSAAATWRGDCTGSSAPTPSIVMRPRTAGGNGPVRT